MARRARLNVPGGVFHMVSRFARDEWRLDAKGARAAYLEDLGEAAATGGVEVLAYCLMSNHVHLVIVQGERPLERFSKSLHSSFAAWSHGHARGRKAQGPVFADRPRTVLVARDEHLLSLVRYVHNNPVRAGVSRFARSSDWSSHQAYIGRVPAPAWLQTGLVLQQFGTDARRAAQRFDAFVDEQRGETRRPALSGVVNAGDAAAARRELGNGHRLSDGVVGSDAFVARVLSASERVKASLSSRGSERRSGAVGRPSVRHVIDAVLTHLDVDALDLVNRPRTRKSAEVKRLAIWTWVHEYAGQQADVARALNLDTSVVSRYYGQAVAQSGEFDQAASAIAARLKHHRNRRTRTRTPANSATKGAQPVRYFVDVDEL